MYIAKKEKKTTRDFKSDNESNLRLVSSGQSAQWLGDVVVKFRILGLKSVDSLAMTVRQVGQRREADSEQERLE